MAWPHLLPPRKHLTRNNGWCYNTYKFSCIFRSPWTFSAAPRQHRSCKRNFGCSKSNKENNLGIQLLLRKPEQAVRLHVQRCFSWKNPGAWEPLCSRLLALWWTTALVHGCAIKKKHINLITRVCVFQACPVLLTVALCHYKSAPSHQHPPRLTQGCGWVPPFSSRAQRRAEAIHRAAARGACFPSCPWMIRWCWTTLF